MDLQIFALVHPKTISNNLALYLSFMISNIRTFNRELNKSNFVNIINIYWYCLFLQLLTISTLK